MKSMKVNLTQVQHFMADRHVSVDSGWAVKWQLLSRHIAINRSQTSDSTASHCLSE